MAVPGNGTPRYEVRSSEAIKEVIRRLHRKARRQNRNVAMTHALRRIIEQLEEDPMHTGEPVYRLPMLRMQVRKTIVRPIVIYFAVCEDRPLVFMMVVKLFGL